MARRGTLIVYIRKQVNSDAPVVPASWTIIPESDNWFSIFPRGREEFPNVYFHMKHMVSHDTLPRAAYVCVGTPVILQRLADMISSDGLAWTRTWNNLVELRADGTALALALKAAWRDQPEGTPILASRMLGYVDDDAEGN